MENNNSLLLGLKAIHDIKTNEKESCKISNTNYLNYLLELSLLEDKDVEKIQEISLKYKKKITYPLVIWAIQYPISIYILKKMHITSLLVYFSSIYTFLPFLAYSTYYTYRVDQEFKIISDDYLDKVSLFLSSKDILKVNKDFLTTNYIYNEDIFRLRNEIIKSLNESNNY